jgi:hypothetical protein
VSELIGLVVVVLVALVAAVVGVRLGIFVIAPQISRAMDRRDAAEEPGDRHD